MGLIKRDKRSCCGVPLAITAIIMCTYILVTSGSHLYQACQYEPIGDASNVSTICVSIFEMIFAGLGLIGVFCKSPRLCSVGSKAVIPAVMAAIIAFIAQWWRWGFALDGKWWEQSSDGTYHWVASDKWKPTGGDIVNMILWTIFQILYLVVLFQLMSVFASLALVFAAGGSGYGWHNANDLLEKEKESKEHLQV